MEELIQILVQFGGGKGGEPGNVAVRFLLPTFFWGILAWISLREYRTTRNRKDLYVGGASIMGMARELLMFTAEYGSLRGFIPFRFVYNYYPPLEHAITMLSCVSIGYAFITFHLGWQRFPRRFLLAATTVILLLYAVTAVAWPIHLLHHPDASFGHFWGDLAFRSAAVLFMGLVLGALIHAAASGTGVSLMLIGAFTCFFLDEFLMVFNILSGERHVGVFAPIRHNLHIWAIPLLLAVYWNELQQRVLSAIRALEALNRDLEERVARRTRQLAEANNELEAFNYAVSHDLRVPIGHIVGVARMVLEDHGAQMPVDAVEGVRRIGAAGERMGRMIEALLEMCRAGRSPLQPVDVDLTEVAREVAAELATLYPERDVRFRVGPGLTARCDQRLIQIVIQNLLDNAWKYTARMETAEIRFETQSIAGENVFVVRDNGVGFDMTHADRLFHPFHRLHSREDFPGVGIGLATVRTIISRHGGRIWCDGSPGAGAAFSFTLPAPMDETAPRDVPVDG